MMSLRRKVPTEYWQAIVAHNLVVLQQGGDVIFLCDNLVAGLTARRDNVLASRCEHSPFHYPPLLNVPDHTSVFVISRQRL